MVNRGPYQDVEDWLAAEAEGDSDDADRLFAAMFSARVPRLRPAPGVPDRVAAALAWPLPERANRPMPRWARASTLVLLAFGGAAAAAFWSTWLFDLLHASWAVGPRMARILAALSGASLAAVSHTWANAAAIGHALELVAASGPGTVLLAANLALALIASFALKRVLSLEEESS